MSLIDDIKVRTSEVYNAELESLLNRKSALQRDMDLCDAEIEKKQAEVSAIKVSYKTAIEASAKAEVVKEE